MALYDFITLNDRRLDYDSDPIEWVFLLIGTSNAGGTNGVATDPYIGPTANTNVFVCNKWVEAAKRNTFVANDPTPGWTRLTESMGLTPGTWGPEVTLGLELERMLAPARINIIKLGVSFGVLHSSASNPVLEFNDADSGSANTAHKLLRDHYLPEYINEVRTRTGGGCYFGGIFSVLGETDTLNTPLGTATSHTDAEANIIDLHNVLLDRITVPMAPWVASLPQLSLPAVARQSANTFDPARIAAVRTGLTNFRDRSQYKRWIELVETSDLPVVGTVAAKDGLHLTGTAQHIVGRRMARQWQRIAKRNLLYRITADLV